VGPSVPSRMGVLLVLIAAIVLASGSAAAATFDGDLAYTSDYVLRGISQTGGRSAGQLDLHVTSADGTFAGAFASTLAHIYHVGYEDLGWNYELQEYVGHRFNLSQSWSTTIAAVNYSYLGGNTPFSNDYQEISAALAYLDSWTVTVAALPNCIHYDRGYRLGRYAAYTADASTQLPLIGRLFLTAGAGYYTAGSSGYAYGNAGLSLEYKSLRLDASYFVAQHRAQELFPYGRAGSRFVGGVSWHF
jgi:uncharacterized protein (TIGR02001 family)